ncbi:RecQ family ATP-dependent DNA helicase [Geobacter sulfurreducens]|uniref:RecQ family ATP-dependent DNA helicase n=1 Tax=Geobacter sulfurreducens TaxID=35554 RepID=UPI002C1BB661|nr:RecQ family ATP-dependent DNA helicase [Geobacter sulfurreducens]HML77353.1 RecQ family ATP-dependent DNA helicase [Geobacter sulfurreducens]
MPAPTDQNNALELLRCALSDPNAEFRDGQWEAIDAIVNQRRKMLVVQRTGWGKSSVYFIATRILRDRENGPTLIVSPLLALMRNQTEAAERLGIRPVTINSTNRDDWPPLIQTILNNEADAVLISPERLANDEFVRTVLLPVANQIGLLVVDEAHCISDWGHDFRPDYRRLVSVLQHMPPNMAVLGTTATANNRVLDDITTQLGNIEVQRGPLLRETLALQTVQLPDQSGRLAWLAEHLPQLPGTGIVYTLTKRDADQVAEWLTQNGITAKAYYSGVEADGFESSDAYRQYLEAALLNNEIKALVATTALGMGYDKPDLGFVVHYQAPGSIVAYYQQVGRAGRAIDYAVGVLLSGREDEEIQEYFRSSAFPDERHVNSILDVLAESDGLTDRQLEADVNLRKGQIDKVLKFLSVENPSPVIKDGSRWRRTPVAYRLDHQHIQRLTQQRAGEWQEVQEYINSRNCLMLFLARSLDDEQAQPCGKCACCLGQPVISEEFSHHLAVAAALYLKHAELPLECKKQVASGAFEHYGFRGNLPENLRAETGRILSRWGDAGWGRIVAEDKHNNHFRDDLVTAVTEMIRERWQPEPAPTWVTCVPSRNHPELVPNFARRLAASLNLPFVEAVTKERDNRPQKLQQNRYHQCRNLDGVFAITPEIPNGPVLLVDDMVDSAWTITVIAALLRRAGSGPVWPVALASTSTGD